MAVAADKHAAGTPPRGRHWEAPKQLELKIRGSPGLAAQYLVAMGAITPVCLADFAAIKVLALLALGLVAYLYWSGFSEKRAERRDRKWLESRRREFKEKAAAKPAPPHEG